MSEFKLDPRDFALAAAFVGFFGLSACNTVEGAGEDLSNAGREIQEEAKEVDEKQ